MKKVIIIKRKTAKDETNNLLNGSGQTRSGDKKDDVQTLETNNLDVLPSKDIAETSTNGAQNAEAKLFIKEQGREPLYYKSWFLLLVSILFAFFALLFGSSSTSPLFIGLQFGVNDFDPSFFLYLGYSFTQGAKPYLEAFDQKGLYIYLFEALGYLIGGRTGVFFLQVVLGSITCFSLMFFAKKYLDSPFQCYAAAAIYVLVTICFKFGNHSGELLMPWVALPFLFYFLGIKTAKPHYFLLGSFFAGLEAGFSIGSRPTEAMWGLAMVFFYFIYSLRHKTKWQLLWNALVCLLGLGLPVMVYCLVAYQGGYLVEMYEAVVVQGLTYLGNHNGGSRNVALIFTIIGVALMLLFSFPVQKKHGTDAFLLILVSVIFSGTANIIIARMTHYWLSSLPLIIIETSLVVIPWHIKDETRITRLKKTVLIGLNSVSVVVASVFAGVYYISPNPITIGGEEIFTCYSANANTRNNLETIKKDGGEVFLVDANASALLYLDKTSGMKFFTNQSWWASDNKDVVAATVSYIENEGPVWIICDKKADETGTMNQEIKDSIEKKYKLYSSLSNDYYLNYYHLA